MGIPDGLTIPSAATPVQNAATQNLVLIPATIQHIPIIPVLSINELRNVIPVGLYSIPPQNLIPGRIAAGHLLQVRSIPEPNPAYAEDLLQRAVLTVSAEATAPLADTQNPVRIPAPVTPIVITPTLSTNVPQNVIPAVKPVPQRNLIPGHTAVGAVLQVQSIPVQNPVLAEDPLQRPAPTVSAEIVVLPADIPKQQLQLRFHFPLQVPVVHSDRPAVKFPQRNTRQVTR